MSARGRGARRKRHAPPREPRGGQAGEQPESDRGTSVAGAASATTSENVGFIRLLKSDRA
jgi:hypothetical protein